MYLLVIIVNSVVVRKTCKIISYNYKLTTLVKDYEKYSKTLLCRYLNQYNCKTKGRPNWANYTGHICVQTMHNYEFNIAHTT